MAAQATTKKRPSFIWIALAGLAGFCVLCVIGSSVMNSLGLVSTRTPSAIPTDTLPPGPTDTPVPSETPLPTNTPRPTSTPLPTFTPTPPPEPIILTGSGDSVVDIEKWEGPAILHVAHNGGGNFAIWNDDAAGNQMDLLVNVIGAYQGTLPLDFLDSEHTARFEITAGGQWELQILPFESVRKEAIPGTVQGTGDDVVACTGTTGPDLLKANATGSSNFIILSYGDNGRDLVINEIAPYTGTVALNRNTFLIVVKATGPWSVEITTK